jgi:polyvinyl alcohol dehydrogenase (cytochrome)
MGKLLAIVAGSLLGAAALAQAQTAPDGAADSLQPAANGGEAVYERVCAGCHTNPALDSRAMPRERLGQLAPETILTALTVGNMFRQGSTLTDSERRAVAGFLAGRPVGAPLPPSSIGRCTEAPQALTASDLTRGWNGWGADRRNRRYADRATAGLEAAQVPALKLKWAFGFAGASSARAQPAVLGGRVFVGSENGDVYALDAETGCTYWSYHAEAGIRTAVSVGRYTSARGEPRFAIYFSDGGANAYAVDAETGAEIWQRHVDEHVYARATGSVTVHDGRVYVPVSGVGEEGQGGTPSYGCCTFRGSVSALDAGTGELVWKTYMVPESRPRGTSSEGAPLFGPAGAGIWAAPTVDAERSLVYVATGNAYAGPDQPTTDALVALDISTGAIRWSFQPTPGDVWAGGCPRDNADNPNCPEALGPDHDFSMSPVLATRPNGDDIVILQQKSGMAYGVDPDTGRQVWQYATSAGAALGGQWGAAADGNLAYFGVNGPRGAQGGLRAVRIGTGEEVWSVDAEPALCEGERGCSQAQGAAVTVVPGVVFAGSMDGGIRAYAADDGEVIWRFDTNRSFDTVNGVAASGGAIDGPGPIVAGGMVFASSGYVSLIGRPGNVLLAFSVE